MSFFSSGTEIDSDAREPEFEMTLRTVNYQNPSDPRKLLSARLDLSTGKFGAPEPMEISVSGGNAAAFKLDGVYGTRAWSGVRLVGPGAFNSKHTLRIDIDGRFASNDIKQNGYAPVSADGRAITTNYLMP